MGGSIPLSRRCVPIFVLSRRGRNLPTVQNRCRSRIRSFIVAPMRGASTLLFCAISITFSGSDVETRMREGASWNRRNSGLRVSRDFDARADTRFAEAGFGQRDRKAAIAQVVRRFGESGGHDLANGLLYSLFVVEIECWRQPPHRFQDHLGVLRSAEMQLVGLAKAAQQNDGAIGILEMQRRRLPGLEQPTMPITGVGQIASPSVSL